MNEVAFAFAFAVLAGMLDVCANLASTKSAGFSKRSWGLLSILLVLAAFGFLAESVKVVDLAVAYAVLGATGIFGTTICGRILFGNRLKPIGWFGLVMIFGAVLVLQST